MTEDYVYGDKSPTGIDKDQLTNQQKDLLINSKTFCMYPWIHLHGFPNGDAYPCCHSEMKYVSGNLKTQSIEEIWNDQPMRDLRVRMLTGQESQECKKCYEQESAGFFSMRQNANKHFGHHISKATDLTELDGTAKDFSIVYWDVRFSNLCNMKCRTCGSLLSSKWVEDDNALYGSRSTPRTIFAGKDKDDIFNQMLPHLDTIEQIYFAGGEPLLMEEHFRILKELVKRELFHIKILYNTNFSTLYYKKNNILELWKYFPNIGVGASLDAVGERAEYIRKYTKWADIERNREQMLKVCPNIDFHVSATLSILNSYNIVDLHRDWVNKGFIKPEDFNVNICLSPAYFRIDVLPQHHKQAITDLYQDHIRWLEPKDRLTRATSGFKSAINFLNDRDQSNLLPAFFKRTDELDRVRNENFESVFKEFNDLRSLSSS